MMKKNTILCFMGELPGRYLKLVFPEIEPHKCVKNNEKKEHRKVKRRQIGCIYNSNRRNRRKEREGR